LVTTASIVIYKTTLLEISPILECLTLSKVDFIYLIDNSPTSLKMDEVFSKKVRYLFNDANIGFGAGHNIALKKAIEIHSNFHFVINPDVEFVPKDINQLVDFMKDKQDVGLLMQRVVNPDFTEQYLPKLIPRPFDMLMRKIKRPSFIYSKLIEQYELRKYMNKGIINTPIISGCFSLFRVQSIQEVGMYDERFFMYMEDWDISRRIHAKFKTLYYPEISIVHRYHSGANIKLKLFLIFVISTVKYFNKWGWFYDSSRKKINNSTLYFCTNNL